MNNKCKQKDQRNLLERIGDGINKLRSPAKAKHRQSPTSHRSTPEVSSPQKLSKKPDSGISYLEDVPAQHGQSNPSPCKEIQNRNAYLEDEIKKCREFKKSIYEYLLDHSHDDRKGQSLYSDFEDLLIDMLQGEFRIVHYTDQTKPFSDKELFVITPLNGVLEIQEKRPASVIKKDGQWMVFSKGKVHVPAMNNDYKY